ncbi:hypothetical protein F5Y10DRAFT_257462 [Nemania abortiva]|nr:hypothetical protein F5Y10DRAFT_257462 [Nemania abortiva]
MPFLTLLRPRPSSNALIAATNDFSTPHISSPPKIRALELLKRKLNVIRTPRSEKYAQIQLLTGSPPPPLGQAFGPVDVHVRTDISYDDHGFGHTLSDGDDHLDIEIALMTELSSDSLCHLVLSESSENGCCSIYDRSTANARAQTMMFPTDCRAPYTPLAGVADASCASRTYDSDPGYDTASISDTSVASDSISFIDDDPYLSLSLSFPSLSGTGITEATGRNSVSPKDSCMTMAMGDTAEEGISKVSSMDGNASGAYKDGSDEFPGVYDPDAWSIVSADGCLVRLVEDVIHTQYVGHAAAISTFKPDAPSKDLETQPNPEARLPTSRAPSPTARVPIKTHPLFAATYGNDPNWAFWTGNDV